MMLRTSRLLHAALLLSVAACTGAGIAPSSVPIESSNPTGRTVASDAAKTLRLYVADQRKNAILVFDVPNSKPVATITTAIDKPQGIALDAKGTLYVANAGNDTITVYPLYHSAPSAQYRKGIHDPSGIVVDSYGNVYYAESSGSIYEFAHGRDAATLVTSRITDPVGIAAAPYGLAAASELYVAEFSKGDVALVQPGKAASVVQSPGPGVYGVGYAQNGELYLSTRHAPAGVYVYARPAAAKPSGEIHSGFTKPGFLALTSERELFVVNGVSVLAFAPDASKPSLRFTGFDAPTGIAAGSIVPTPRASSTPTPAATATPTLPPTPTPGPLSAAPTTLTFASAAPQTFVADESGYTGSIAATSSDKKIATVTPAKAQGSGATFTVTPVAYGNCTIDLKDGKGNTAAVTVVVNNGVIIVSRANAASVRGGR
jgi:hypothetical protein